MVDILNQHKDKIIITGLVLGVLLSLGIISPETGILGFDGVYVKYLMVAVTGLGGWLFYSNYMSGSPGIKRTVPVRNLSSPNYQKDIARQAEGLRPQTPPIVAPPQPKYETPEITDKMWDKFNEENK